MNASITLFIGMFTTLLAIINPLEAIPVFLGLMQGKDRRGAEQGCPPLLSLCVDVGVFLSAVRNASAASLRHFPEHDSGGRRDHSHPHRLSNVQPAAAGKIGSGLRRRAGLQDQDVAFIPLAMPIMFGPGAIATILGMASTVKRSSEELESFVAISLAIIVTMAVTYLSLVYSKGILKKSGRRGSTRLRALSDFSSPPWAWV